MASQTRGSSRAVPSFGCAVQPAVTSADHGVSAAVQRAVGHTSLSVGTFNVGPDHVDGAHRCGVFQPAASSRAVQDLIEDIVKFGSLAKKNKEA